MLLAILCGDPRTTVNSNADGQLSAVQDVRQKMNTSSRTILQRKRESGPINELLVVVDDIPLTANALMA
jgi:hypothetical protein